MKKWPNDCPVFRVTKTGALALKGALVVGVFLPPSGLQCRIPHSTDYYPSDTHVGVHVVCGHNPESDCQHPTEKWFGAMLHYTLLRPLTPAARDMLALVRR